MRKKVHICEKEMRCDFQKKYNINKSNQNDARNKMSKFNSDNCKKVSPNTVGPNIIKI